MNSMLYALLNNGRGVKIITAVAVVLSLFLVLVSFKAWRQVEADRPWEPLTEWSNPMGVDVRDGQIRLKGRVCNTDSNDITTLITIIWESETTSFVQYDRAPYRFAPGCTPLSKDPFPVAAEATPGEWKISTIAQPVARPSNTAPAITINASTDLFEIK